MHAYKTKRLSDMIATIYYNFYVLDFMLVMKNSVYNSYGTVANCVT